MAGLSADLPERLHGTSPLLLPLLCGCTVAAINVLSACVVAVGKAVVKDLHADVLKRLTKALSDKSADVRDSAAR